MSFGQTSNDEFSVEYLKIISFELMHPYNILNVPQIVKLAAIKKDNNNKYLVFNTNFDIRRSVQMT